MRLFAVGLLASLAIAAPASAQSENPATAEATEAKEAPPAKAKRVCRSIKVTGQRVPRRECKLEAEWISVDAVRDSNEAIRLKSAGSISG